MLKWIIGVGLMYTVIGGYFAVNSSYTPISQQIDMKTMSVQNPSYMIRTWSTCTGTCKNYSSSSSSSSWGGGSYGGK
ncbi:MAG: hypothetical protein GY828_02590 [Candidatus Gracilibacteria bacterium]|nr:hypothetical protein [Candidatus Gracilibacteria bacterium]